MPTEQFTKDEFQSALPPQARYIGLIGGEHCWTLPILRTSRTHQDPTGDCHVEIDIRSSIRKDGVAAVTGHDSIRCTLVDSVERKPLATKASKPQRWVARTKNWRTNLLDVLRRMYKLGLHLGTCPVCKVNQTKLCRVLKDGPNKGRLFVTCDCKQWGDKSKFFFWIDEE